MKLRIIVASLFFLNVINFGMSKNLVASQVPPEAGVCVQDWISVATTLKSSGYSAPQVKVLVMAMQKAGVQPQTIGGKKAVLSLAKTIAEKLKHAGITEDGLQVISDDIDEATTAPAVEKSIAKWKWITAVCLVIATGAIILWYYEYCKKQEAEAQRLREVARAAEAEYQRGLAEARRHTAERERHDAVMLRLDETIRADRAEQERLEARLERQRQEARANGSQRLWLEAQARARQFEQQAGAAQDRARQLEQLGREVQARITKLEQEKQDFERLKRDGLDRINELQFKVRKLEKAVVNTSWILEQDVKEKPELSRQPEVRAARRDLSEAQDEQAAPVPSSSSSSSSSKSTFNPNAMD